MKNPQTRAQTRATKLWGACSPAPTLSCCLFPERLILAGGPWGG